MQSIAMFYKNIGAWIKKERLEKKQTQTNLSKVLGVTFQQIQKYEKASNQLNLHYFMKLCDHFGKDYTQVLSNCKDNLFLPEELIKQGYITVSTEEISKDPNINLSANYWIEKKSE